MVLRTAALSLVCLGLFTGSALASRAAHPSERRAIVHAARVSPDTQGVRGKFDVVHLRISTVDHHWAGALLRPKKPYRHQLDTAMVAFHLAHGRWTLRSLGTSDVGCVVKRAAVRRDLQLQCSR